MQLKYAPVAVIFFSEIFEYTTYDVLPTADIYAAIFGWVNEPYSDEAGMIGYESRYLIENAGSLPIYITLALTTQLIYFIGKLVARSGRLFEFLSKKQSQFFWAGAHEFFANAYMTLGFCFLINTSKPELLTTAIGVNNVSACIIALILVLIPIIVPAKVF